MPDIKNADYSNWSNQKAVKIAKKVDKDGIKGLNNTEIVDFTKFAIQKNFNETDIFELLGLYIPKNSRNYTNRQRSEIFEKAINYYNTLDIVERSDVTYQTYNKGEEILHNMETDIDKAFVECEAYQDILIIPQRRPHPERLLNFDLEYIRNITEKDMNALYELKDKIQTIIEQANGIEEHTTPEKTEFDVDELALKHLGMSYEEFAEKYKEELNFFKTVTYADLNNMTDTQRTAYAKAKTYAKAMLQAEITEAHTVRWDTGEKVQEETSKYIDNMFNISEFEYDNITDRGLNNITSGIMYKAFEETLIEKYNKDHKTGIETNHTDDKKSDNKVKKIRVGGVLLLMHPDGKVYDETGKRIK